MNILYFDIRMLVYRDLECNGHFSQDEWKWTPLYGNVFLKMLAKHILLFTNAYCQYSFVNIILFPFRQFLLYIYGLLLYTSQSAFSYKLDLTTQRIDNNTVIIMHEDAMIASFVYYFTPNTFVDMFLFDASTTKVRKWSVLDKIIH